MAVTIAQLQAQIGLNNAQFLAGVSQSNTAWKGLQGALALGGAAGAAGAGMAAITNSVIDMGKQIIQATLDYQEGMGAIQSLTGQTGEALAGLQSVAGNSFLHLTQGMQEVGVATALLTDRTKLTGKALEDLVMKEGNLSRVTGENLKTVVESTTLAMNKWGLQSGSMSRELDTLMGISQRTGTSITTLTDFLKRGGAQFQDMGLDINQAAQMMAEMESHGVNAAQVLMGLRQGVSNLAAAHVPLREGTIAVIKLLENEQDPVKRLSEAIHLLGKRNGEELVEAMKLGTISLKSFTSEVDTSTDSIKKAAAQANPLKDSLTELGHEIQSIFALGKNEQNGLANYFHNAAIAVKEAAGFLHQVKTAMEWIDQHTSVTVTVKAPTSGNQLNTGDADSQKIITERYQKYLADRTAASVDWQKHAVESFNIVGLAGEHFTAEQEAQAKRQMAADAAVAKLAQGKPKTVKLTETQKEAAELKKLTEEAQAQLAALDTGTNAPLAKLEGHFRKLGTEGVKHLFDLRQRLEEFAKTASETKTVSDQMTELHHKLDVLASGGKETKETLKDMFPRVSGQLLTELANLTQQYKDAEEAAKKHQEALEHEKRLATEGARKIADLHAEYLRLTHTRYEDIIALELYGKTADEVLDKEHQKVIASATFWMRTVEAQKELIASTKEWKAAEESLGKAIEDMKLKLALKTPLDEQGAAVRASLIEFDRLPQARRQIEENAEAQARFKKSYADLSAAHQKEIDLVLQETHALAIKTKADEEADAATKRSMDLTKNMTVHLAELNEKIKELTDPNKNKQSKFVTAILAEQLKLTDEQKKLLDQIIAKEKELSEVEKHAATMKKLATELRGEFTHMFEDMMHGGKNAFATLEQDFTKMLQQMAAKYLASRLTSLFMGLVGGALGGGGKVSNGGSNAGGFQQFAVGGYMAPGQMALVGENGPELFRANGAGQVIPNDQISSNRGGVTVNMTVNAQDANSFRYSSNQLAAQLGSAIQRAQIRNG